MTAYFILTHTITDLDRYRSEYIPLVLPFIAKHGGVLRRKALLSYGFHRKKLCGVSLMIPSTSQPKSCALQ